MLVVEEVGSRFGELLYDSRGGRRLLQERIARMEGVIRGFLQLS